VEFYKVLKENERHNGLQFGTGDFIDFRPFIPEPGVGGIHFARGDVLAFLRYGPWIRRVTLPSDARVYRSKKRPREWKADCLELHPRQRITAEVVRDLLEQGARIRPGGDLALIWASRMGYVAVAAVLLEYGADLHVNDDEPLCTACEFNENIMVRFLLERGANLAAQTYRPIRVADELGHNEIVSLIIDWEKKINREKGD
jgi:hypothetical protein